MSDEAGTLTTGDTQRRIVLPLQGTSSAGRAVPSADVIGQYLPDPPAYHETAAATDIGMRGDVIGPRGGTDREVHISVQAASMQMRHRSALSGQTHHKTAVATGSGV
jgi:hypothetical protein